MNAITRPEALLPAFPIFSEPRAAAIATLCKTLYPDATPEAAELVLDYCRARRLDPMQKPVHLMWVEVNTGKKDDAGEDIYERRQVPLPGIGMYRIQATQTGAYAGQDEPEFGPMKTLTYKKRITEWKDAPGGRRRKETSYVDASLEYPEWCKVVVYRLVQGVRCPFPAVERWTENYGTASRWSTSPNSMWERRVFAQLAKCAEAQALRKGFPDAVDSSPTSDEVEGRQFDFEAEELAAEAPPPPVRPQRMSQAAPPAAGQGAEASPPEEPRTQQAPTAQPAPQQQPAPQAVESKELATEGERKHLLLKLRTKRISAREFLKEHEVLGVTPDELDGLTKAQFMLLKGKLA